MAAPSSVADKHSLHYKAMDTAFDEWFGKFDGDQSGTLDREELTALLVHLHPDMPPPQASYVGLLPSEFEPPNCCFEALTACHRVIRGRRAHGQGTRCQRE